MPEKLPVPSLESIQLLTQDVGSVFQGKMNAATLALRDAIIAFNAQIDAAQTAEQQVAPAPLDVALVGENNTYKMTPFLTAKFLQSFGLGVGGDSAVYAGSLNGVARTRFFNCGPNTTGGPTGVSLDGSKCLHMQWADSLTATQLLWTYLGDSWERTIIAGVPSVWVRSYTGLNIVGAVAHSGGVPTGAIIQKGSNASGSFVRFADGTQICTFIRSSALGMGSYSSTGLFAGYFIWQYPAEFILPPAISGSGFDSVTTGWISSASHDSLLATIAYFSSSSTNSGAVHMVTAIGRWY